MKFNIKLAKYITDHILTDFCSDRKSLPANFLLFFNRYAFAFILNIVCISFVSAQTKNADVVGHVTDNEGRVINGASVYLLKYTDSSVVKFTTTIKGLFVFNDIKTGTYLISITSTGYKRGLSNKIVCAHGAPTDAGFFKLQIAANKLKEVAITGQRNFIDVKADRIVLNIHSSIYAVGNTVYDILKLAPGVQIDNNDNISLKGKADVLVMIDNKPTYLSGTALADLLKGTQSGSIDKIELISNPNATYDAEGAGGVINIRMLRDKALGFNAQVNGSGGVTQPGFGYDSKLRESAGINFNYREKKLNIFGSYTFANLPAFRSSTSDRLDSYTGKVNTISDNWFLNQYRKSNNFRLGADYNITGNQSVGILVSGSFLDVTGPKNTVTKIATGANIDSTILTNSSLNRSQSNYTYNINYKGDFKKAGIITVDGNYINFDKTYNEQLGSNYFNGSSTTPYRSLSLLNNTPTHYDVYFLNAVYHLNVNANNNFSAGFKDSYSKANYSSNFGAVNNNVYSSYPAFTGVFNYTEKVYAVFGDYNHTFNKNTNIELGLRIEQAVTNGEDAAMTVANNYVDFFPNLQLNHSINADNQLSLTYSRRITRPKLESLSPLLIYNDQYDYQIGNPYLKPFYSNKIELNHLYKNKFSTSLTFAITNGFVQSVYMQNDATQVSTLRTINLGNRYSYGLHFTDPFTFTKWYSLDFNLETLYDVYTGTDFNYTSFDVLNKVTQHFKFPWSMRADFTAVYETPTTYGIYRYKHNFYGYAGINKSILNKKGSISLQVDNLFQSDKNVYYTRYKNLDFNGTQVNIFRSVFVNFSYAFGSQTIKAARRNTSADEEQGRINPLN